MTFHVARLVPKEKKRKVSPSEVTVTKVHPDVLRRVRELPGYDPALMEIVDSDTVILKNRRSR